MTLYARSDLDTVALSRDGHGGCGQVHSRPVTNGAPEKLWALTCPQCENHLRTDANWSVTVSAIPETPDELAEREEREKRGQQEATAATGTALQEIAKQGGMNQQMMMAMFNAMNTKGLFTVADAMCQNGHAVAAAAKFCPECGAPQHDAPAVEPVRAVVTDVTDTRLAATQSVAAHIVLPTPDFESMGIRELQTYAAEHGIKTTRAKADQIKLIRATQG
jgi:hypothetical protein